MAVALALVFCLSAGFFLSAYKQYAVAQETLRDTMSRAELLTAHQKELARKKGILKRVRGFVDRARSAGVERDKWAFYDVSIEDAVAFEEAEQILEQTANSSSYYFKPIMLHAKTQSRAEAEAPSTTTAAASGDSFQTRAGDVLLTLRGSFVVNRQ